MLGGELSGTASETVAVLFPWGASKMVWVVFPQVANETVKSKVESQRMVVSHMLEGVC